MATENVGEVWRPVPGYDGKYLVSNTGEVKTLVNRGGRPRTDSGRKRALNTNSKGYLYASLRSRGVSRNVFVHRMVVAAFVGPIPEGMQVNHKDGNKQNNHLSNLECVTSLQNVRHAVEVLQNHARGERHGRSSATNETISRLWEMLADGVAPADASRRLGFSKGFAGVLLRGETWKHFDSDAKRRVLRRMGRTNTGAPNETTSNADNGGG